MMFKKRWTIWVVGILLFFMTGCGKEENVVHLYNWGDYIDMNVIREFEQETGITVKMDNYETNEDMYIKLTKGGGKYDLVIPSDYMIERLIKEDMLQKIDRSKLENYDEIGENFRTLSYDPTGEYSIPYFWGTVGIAYNTKVVKEKPDSWDILWDERYKDNIFMMNSQRDTIGAALKKLGYSMNTRDLNELERAKEILIEQKPLVSAYTLDNTKDAMVAEEAAIALTWSGEAQVMHQENPAIEYFIPKEGSNIWFDSVVMMKDAENVENALKFIDFLLRPSVSAKNVIYVGYSTPLPNAIPLLPEYLRNSKVTNPELDSLPEMEIFKNPEDFVKEYEKVWLEISSEN